MVRYSFLGNTGSGKTLLATKFIIDKYNEGYKVYCNFHLKNIDYTFIDNLDFHEQIDRNEKNIVVVDEIGEIAKGIHKHGFEKLMAQSRKSIGNNQVFIIISQVKNQQSNILLSMIDYIVKPKLMETKIDNKPAFMTLYIYEIKHKINGYKVNFLNKLVSDVRGVCDYYDESEMVTSMKDTSNKYLLEKYKGFVGTTGLTKSLAKHLEKHERLNKTEAYEEARYIINYNTIKDLIENGE